MWNIAVNNLSNIVPMFFIILVKHYNKVNGLARKSHFSHFIFFSS